MDSSYPILASTHCPAAVGLHVQHARRPLLQIRAAKPATTEASVASAAGIEASIALGDAPCVPFAVVLVFDLVVLIAQWDVTDAAGEAGLVELLAAVGLKIHALDTTVARLA